MGIQRIDKKAMRIGGYGALGALLVAYSCSTSYEAAITHMPPASPDVLLRHVELQGVTWSAEDVESVLGEPVRAEVQPAEGADSLRTLEYYGLEIGLVETGASSRVAFLALTDARYTAPEGIRVGFAEAQVLQSLGSPKRRVDDRWIYPDTGGRRLVVFVEARVVYRIEWRFGAE